MKKCQYCGGASKDQAKFCTVCGKPFALEPAKPAPEKVSETVPAPVAQAPELEEVQSPPAEQRPVAETPAPSTYGYVQPAQQPQAQRPAPPTYDYVPPAQQPQIQQSAPPTYDYVPPVQQPYVQQSAPPTYGYVPPAQQPQVQQSAPPTYGHVPPAQQPQVQQSAPPTYGHVPPAQQPHVQQSAPPTYGYVPPAQQPQVQQPAPPTYGYTQQPPQHQAAPVYNYSPQAPATPKPEKPKKKRRWLIPVIVIAVVAILALGAFLIFGDQIKGLFGGSSKTWLDAEKSLFTTDDDSIFKLVQESLDKQVNQTKFGGNLALSMDVKGDIDPDTAKILDIIGKLRISADYKMDTNKDDPQFYTTIGLGKRDSAEDTLTLQVYSVDGKYVIDASPILDKPLVFPAESFQNMMNTGGSSSAVFEGGSTEIFNTMKNISDILSSPEKFSGDLLDIVAKHVEKPEVEKGEVLTVEGISQKFDKYTVVVKTENTPKMIKDILTYIRDSEDIRKIVDELGALSEKLNPPAPGKMYSNSFSYESFVESIDKAIKETEDNPANFSFEFVRELYIDENGNPQGGTLVIRDTRKEKKNKINSITLEHFHVESDGKHAYKLLLHPEGEEALVFTSEYTLQNKRYTGTYKLVTAKDDKETAVLSGSVDDFGFEETDGIIYPVGTLEIVVNPSGTSMPSPISTPNNLSFTYDGKIEKKSDGPHLVATVALVFPGTGTENSMKLMIDHLTLPEKDISFDAKLPTDYIDASDNMAIMQLFSDPQVMIRLTQALSELGIDISQFMGDLPIW
ncbi:MAG TPA: hypothetical protein GX734_05650 [Clostridiaceae bacterium]|nr:hypothetical protein [Clostridiaceae bacterium]